ncbi:MAG: hypothetical protein AAB660_02195 [Patescibacteria group bacterium]
MKSWFCGAGGFMLAADNLTNITQSGSILVHGAVGMEIRVGKIWLLPSVLQSQHFLPHDRNGYYRAFATGFRWASDNGEYSLLAEGILVTFDLSSTGVLAIRDIFAKVHTPLADLILTHTRGGIGQQPQNFWSPEISIRVFKTPVFALTGFRSTPSITENKNINMGFVGVSLRFTASSR